ncbi:fimbrial biogenesis chaperone [Proteus myxofaciens]|uniref:Putative fimbrial chaperone protein n=1 Tax=Proteus myxofaciens ATCC 19692 TaxID=1354337 RepID=A0A198GS25_9GAMM|nr:molecular chaperone [Proteus myxofaciens]OAT39036.1 putative fimbrial chaperone protein [Proteus myxofaciens ATCC 19692]
MFKNIIVYIISILFISSSYASIQVSQDKFFYKENDKEVLFHIKNKDEHKKYIVQSWVSNYNKEDNSEAPFIIVPSLIKLSPNEKFTLKIVKTEDVKEINKESVYRVNIKLVPIVDDKIINKNILLISLNSIYNLFYTPLNILKNDDDKNIEVDFFTDGKSIIKVKNPMPYFITIEDITIDNINILDKATTIPPYKNHIINNKKTTNIKNKKVYWKRKNEYGEIITGTPKDLINE